MKCLLQIFRIILLINILLSTGFSQSNNHAKITEPVKHFGFIPGSDGNLFLYDDLISYLEVLDKESPKLKLHKIGESSLGKDMFIAFISSEENIDNLNRLKELNKTLALDPNLKQNERETLFQEGKVFFLATLSMHSSEVGPSQSAPLIAHELVNTTDPEINKW